MGGKNGGVSAYSRDGAVLWKRVLGDKVRELVAAGKTDEEVYAYFVARHGEWALLSPKAEGFNWLVWLGPVILLVIGGFVVARRATAPIDGPQWGMWPAGGAWLTLALWDRYEYTGDRDYLRTIYPMLKGAARFFSMNAVYCGGTSSSGKIADTGHSGSHAPQSMHSSGSMTSMFLPSRNASTGQTSTHARSLVLMHGSAIT